MFQEVAECNARTPEVVQGLVQPEDTERVLNGYAVRTPRRIDPEAQTALAERASAGSGFLVLVGADAFRRAARRLQRTSGCHPWLVSRASS
ncbi:hypothetical protein [Streptomyces qaidamensis]|uniref:hypothetical protein n=1 Tax=Streptomyces qaidamensis TaxID=1783515 RepID=UPI000AB30AAD|nr:hypothetical protein [Streptomyces qaidamensis]